MLMHSSAITPCPEPGVYQNVSLQQYLAWDAVSHSDLKTFMQAPLKYKAGKLRPKEPTKDMKFGSLVHTMVLERNTINMRYAIAPICDRRTKEGKAIFAEFEAKSQGREVVTREDFERAELLAESVHTHGAAGKLLAGNNQYELSIVWKHEPTGILCKSRLDCFNHDLSAIVDLKTALDASPSGFEKQVWNLGYYTSCYFYKCAAAKAALKPKSFIFIAVEKDFPHLTATYEAHESVIDAAEGIVERALERFQECQETDYWPGYGDGIQYIHLPHYAIQSLT